MTPHHHLPFKKIFSFLAGKDPFIFLETTRCDPENFFSYVFFEPNGKIEANDYSDLPRFFNQAESLLNAGYYLAGFFSYEAGNFFNCRGSIHRARAGPVEWSQLNGAGRMNPTPTRNRSTDLTKD